MMKITNNAKRPLGLAGGPSLTLKPNESAEITASQLASFRKNKIVARWMESGVLKVEGAPDEPEKVKIEKPETTDAAFVGLPKGVKGKGAELHHHGFGLFDVYVNGFKVTDVKVKKVEAERIAKEYE